MDFHDGYRPFRNRIRQFDRLQGLIDVWGYAGHVVEGEPLRKGFAVDRHITVFSPPISHYVYPWDLDVIAKELVLNGGSSGRRSLRSWADLTVVINHIRRLDDLAFQLRVKDADILLELHRLAHRQFPWQSGGGFAPMVRAFKVFGEAAVETVVQRELGMSTRQYIILGAAVAGHFIKEWGMSTRQDYVDPIGIPLDASKAFFNRISLPVEKLREKIATSQVYDSDWLYSWNPLEAFPLIVPNSAHPDRVICPIPRHILRRATTGIFYDLVKSSDFDNPYGNSFQNYVGEVIRATCKPPEFNVFGEEPYHIGTNRFHGADWILSDKSGHIFIEAKTKRFTLPAKTRLNSKALQDDLAMIADAITQNYANISRAIDGRTRWINDNLPIFPLILTLEDLFLLSPRTTEMLRLHVLNSLTKAGVPHSILDEMPYTVASASEFELVSQVVAQVGISAVFSKKVRADTQPWSLKPFALNFFKDEVRQTKPLLFPGDWARLIPDEIKSGRYIASRT